MSAARRVFTRPSSGRRAKTSSRRRGGGIKACTGEIVAQVRNVALLTDFGTRDPYVAAMKGVIAARTRVPIHDLTHEIAPFDVFEAAWFLRAVVPYWTETVFVCVVDPGVGTSRRILAVRHESNVLLAPDNGLVSLCGAAGFSPPSDV